MKLPGIEKFLGNTIVIGIIHSYLTNTDPLLVSNILCSDEIIALID